MSIDTALERYFDAWNSHEPEAVVGRAHRRRHLRGSDHGWPAHGRRARRQRGGCARRVPRRALRDRQRRRRTATPRPRSGACSAPTPARCRGARPPAVARPARRRLLHLRRRRRPGQLGRRLLRHRHDARPTRSAGPHHAGRHGAGDQVRVRTARRHRSRHDARRVHRHVHRDRRRSTSARWWKRPPPSSWSSSATTTTSAAASPQSDAQLHLHRVDDARKPRRPGSAATRTRRP